MLFALKLLGLRCKLLLFVTAVGCCFVDCNLLCLLRLRVVLDCVVISFSLVYLVLWVVYYDCWFAFIWHCCLCCLLLVGDYVVFVVFDCYDLMFMGLFSLLAITVEFCCCFFCFIWFACWWLLCLGWMIVLVYVVVCAVLVCFDYVWRFIRLFLLWLVCYWCLRGFTWICWLFDIIWLLIVGWLSYFVSCIVYRVAIVFIVCLLYGFVGFVCCVLLCWFVVDLLFYYLFSCLVV